MRHDLSLFADYRQTYLQDEAAEGDLSEAWTPQANADGVAIAPGTVGIGTARTARVPVVLELFPADPGYDPADWDHIVECDLDCATGTLVIAGCTDYFPDALRVKAPRGNLRVRLLFAGLNTISADGLEGGDSYHVHLWAGAPSGLQILKRDPTVADRGG
jgi:hypothetical protein